MSYDLANIARSMNEKLESKSRMQIGVTIKHPDGRMVKIKSGQYLSNGRVSNFWYWNETMPDGSLGPEEHGYGW